ncbi:iron chelate uptake ABC transporter family permease subunit [Klebsiella pneumoniae subsp. pneumoniae]|nr:iron chelate uptake ABC transporter family permease subunit [Klebsiella pneumoniae subsp. pneumoniae]
MLVGSAPLVRRMRLLEMGDDYRLRAGGAGRAFAPAADAGGGGALPPPWTALAGPISFIALVAPHIARRLSGTARWGLTQSALCGALRAGAGRLRRPTAVYAVAAAGWRVNRQPRRYLPYCIVDSGVPQK